MTEKLALSTSGGANLELKQVRVYGIYFWKCDLGVVAACHWPQRNYPGKVWYPSVIHARMSGQVSSTMHSFISTGKPTKAKLSTWFKQYPFRDPTMRRSLVLSGLLGLGKQVPTHTVEVISSIETFIGQVLACSPGWYGTAPSCDGECPFGMRQTRTSDCGDGRCCWTGHKVYCECIDDPGGCDAVWIGHAPFCDPGSCPDGWHEGGQSDWGDGGYCITGKKKLCECDGGGGRPCTPKPADVFCAGVFLICDNSCSSFVCGGCLGFG